MKKLLLSFVFLFSAVLLNAQAPDAFNYQAVARDNTGASLPNQAIAVLVTIHDVTSGGAVVYQERQTATTNQFGLFSCKIGTGSVLNGTFATVDWAGGAKFLQVGLDPAGGTTYADMGTTQLISVPYAKVADVALNSYWGASGNNIVNTNPGHVYIGGSPYLDGGLVIRGTGGIDNALALEDTVTNAHWSMEVLGNDFLVTKGSGSTFSPVRLYSTGQIQLFNTAGNTDMFIDNAGQVGIGTTAPAGLLHVHSPGNFASIRFTSNTTGITSSDGFLVGTNTSAGDALVWNFESQPIKIGTNGTERMRIDAAGNVGIGTQSPGSPLHIVTTNYPAIQVDGSSALWSGCYMNATNTSAKSFYGYQVGGTVKAYTYADNSGDYIINNNGANHMTVSPNGSVSTSNDGAGLANASISTVNANAAGIGLYISTNSTDANAVFTNAYYSSGTPTILAKFFDGGASDIVRVDNWGAHQGRISLWGGSSGTNGGGYIFGNDTYGAVLGDYTNTGNHASLVNVYHPTVSTTAFVPWNDNSTSCGSAVYRWNAVYAANGTIQTSDERMKENVKPISRGLTDVMSLNPVSYQWKDVQSRLGSGSNLGFLAQDLEKVLPEVVVHSQISQDEINNAKKEKGIDITNTDTYGVKYSEIIPVLVKAIQEQQAEINALKEQVKNQKN